MKLKFKVRSRAAALIPTIALACAAHAANPLEQVINQQAEKLQQRSSERRGSDNYLTAEERHEGRNQHNHREHRGHEEGAHRETGNNTCSDERNLRSVQGNVHTTMKFVNQTRQEIRSYWLDYNGRRVFYKAIAPNASYTQPTFRTHPWVITDAHDNCISIFVSNQPSAVAQIR